jgi:hypothetical protein
MNDGQREDLVTNDEGLYDLWKASGETLKSWTKKNRALIDDVSNNVRDGVRHQHYLKYG